MERRQHTGPLLILLAGTFWGSMGLFVRALNTLGFSSAHVACLRLAVGAVIFLLLLLVTGQRPRMIRLRDMPLFLGLGLGSVLSFTMCYFRAIQLMPLATAAILLYTAPIWVTIMSALFFREKLTGRKLLALALAFSGCVLVSGLSGGALSPAALAFGLGSGVGYALYSILGTVALRRYPPLTVTAWTFLFAALGALPVCDVPGLFAVTAAAPAAAVAWLIPGTALITAVIPYLAYTKGLRGTEPGRASILATVEPVVAALLGAAVYREMPTIPALLGIALVLAAIVLLSVPGRK